MAPQGKVNSRRELNWGTRRVLGYKATPVFTLPQGSLQDGGGPYL